jgi:hypothetical protein
LASHELIDIHSLRDKVALKRLLDGLHDGVNDLSRGLVREALRQGGAADIEDVANGLLGADVGDVRGEGTLEALERGLGSAGKLGDLTPQSARGLPTVLGEAEEYKDARRCL